MKQLLLTICSIILINLQSKAQLDTIPNAGFEDWYFTPIWTIEASGWQTNNSSIAAWNVVPDSVPHTGLLALKIQKVSYRGVIWSGFPLSQQPLTFDCFIKNGLSLGDTAFLRIHIYNSNVIVDSLYQEIYGGIGTNYLPFSFMFLQNVPSVDSCVIILEGGNMNLSSISFDDLSFSFVTSADELNKYSEWKIFPNPVSDELIVWSSEFGDKKEIAIFDMFGNRILSQQPASSGQHQLKLDISELSPGIYLVSIYDGKSKSSTRIIKQ